MDADRQREAVVREALTWLGTPYHSHARVKGAGVDCAMLLAEVFERAGVMTHQEPGAYPVDWHLHRSEERFIAALEAAGARPVAGTPQPGDVALFRFGRTASHGSIVLEWPRVIHAHLPVGKVTLDDATNGPLARRFVGAWTFFGEGA